MIWGNTEQGKKKRKRESKEALYSKLNRLGKVVLWFAWHPVKINCGQNKGKFVWLQKVPKFLRVHKSNEGELLYTEWMYYTDKDEERP